MITTFFGSDLDGDIAETLLWSRWEEKARNVEPSLFLTKDWDERVYHPVIATYHWAHIYTEEVRLMIRAHIDNTPPRVTPDGRVIDWMPLKTDIMEPPSGAQAIASWRRKLGVIIRARQWADTHGIPYRVQIKTGLNKIYFGRYYLLEHSKMPNPALLNGEQIRDQVLLVWVDALEAQIQYGHHSRYVLANRVKHPDVNKHVVWILKQIRRRAQPHFALGKFIKLGLLDPAVVRVVFPAAIDKALTLAA